jgi:hypothetical protein
MITHTEISHLKEFCELVRELRESKFGQRVAGVKPITVRGHEGFHDAEVVNFDEDECRSFLLSFRLLVQDNDNISIRCVWRIFADKIVAPEWFKRVDPPKWMLNDFLDRSAIYPAPGGGDQTMREVFEVFLYGAYAHRLQSPEKRAKYLSWRANHRDHVIQKMLFLMCLQTALNMAERMETAIRDWIRQNAAAA